MPSFEINHWQWNDPDKDLIENPSLIRRNNSFRTMAKLFSRWKPYALIGLLINLQSKVIDDSTKLNTKQSENYMKKDWGENDFLERWNFNDQSFTEAFFWTGTTI